MGTKLMAAEVERNGPVGIVKIHPVERMMERSLQANCDEFIEVHTAIAIGLEELRFDNSIRIVVVTGSKDDMFYVAPTADHYTVDKYVDGSASRATWGGRRRRGPSSARRRTTLSCCSTTRSP